MSNVEHHSGTPLEAQPKYAQWNLVSKILGGVIAGTLAFGLVFVTFYQ